MSELDEAAIFNDALTMGGSHEREAYLRQACGDDQQAYERVAAMVRAYQAEPDFLESPPVEVDAKRNSRSFHEGPGSVIGRYKLLELIGEGGFAVVYSAEQTEPIRRQVALKIIKLGMDTRQVIARFEAERQALAMMDHPGIAKVYDAGATDTGRPYFVMQLIRGIPITEYCDRYSLTTEFRLRLFIDICHAVQHAHQKGIIHRDIKPTNVLAALLDGQAVPKVIDFGIAKATHQRLTEKTLYTSSQQIIGTPQYMSPEQAESSDLDIDTRSDIYSLGVLMYELLTSTTPLTHDELQRMGYDEICHTIRHSDPPTPSRRLSTLGDAAAAAARNREIDPAGLRKLLRGDLDWIVMKCLEKDRNRRYETADALALDIQRHLAGEPTHARRTSGVERIWRWTKRNRLSAALSFAVASLVLLVATTAPMIAWQQSRLLDDTRQQLYAKDMAVAYNDWNDGDFGHLSEVLKRYSTGSQFEHYREFSWYFLQGMYERTTASFMRANRFDISLPAKLLAAGRPDRLIHLYDVESWSEVGTIPWIFPSIAAIRLSPDGRFLAAAHEKGTVTVSEVASRKHMYTIEVGSYAAALYVPVFSPDGSLLATGGPEDVANIWETRTGKLLHTLAGHHNDVSALAFSPDGKTLATGSFDNSLRLWETDSGNQLAVVENAHNGRIYALAFDPSGQRFALGGWGDDVSIWDPVGKKLASLSTPGAGSLCFSPDGRLLAVGGDRQGTVHVWNVDEGTLVTEFRVGHISATVAFLPNGELLFESDNKLMRRNLDIRSAQAGGYTSRPQHERIAIDVSAVHDFVVAGYGQYGTDPGVGAIACWDLHRGKRRILPGHDGTSVFDVAMDPAGRLIVAGGGPSRGPGFVKLWDAQSGALISELPQQKTVVSGVAFSPRGDRLAVGANGSVSVWGSLAGQPEQLWSLPTNGLVRVAFAPSGDVLAVGKYRGDESSSSVMILNAETGEPLEAAATAAFDRAITELAFSPDGRLLASIEYNGNVEIFDRHQQRTVLSELAHGRLGFGVAFSPDGRTLASASTNGQIKFWHLPTMMHVATFKTRGSANSLAFFPNGKTLAVGYSDRTVELWHVDRERELFAIDGTE